MLPKNILVPTDFSSCAERALDYACQLAKRFDAMVFLVHAIGPAIIDLPLTTAITNELVRDTHTGLEQLAYPRRAIAAFGTPYVTVGDPRDSILSAAQGLDADLIVMGTHGRRGFSRLMLGSVAEEVIRRSTCPVLVVPSKAA